MFGILVPLGIALLGAMIWLWPSGNYQELSLDDPLWHHRQFHGGIRLGLIGAQYTL